ncbi:hypothetical protein GCM10020256_69120 [Streptomyces thermocoprophilus]
MTGVVRHAPLLRPRTASTREPQTLMPRRVSHATKGFMTRTVMKPGLRTCVDRAGAGCADAVPVDGAGAVVAVVVVDMVAPLRQSGERCSLL